MTSQVTSISRASVSSSEALREWRRGWPTVLAGLFGFALFSLGLVLMQTFMGPLQAAFHWSRSEYSLAFTIHTVPGFILPPVVGVAVDRFGPKVVAVTGALAIAASVSLFGLLTGSVLNWLLLWGLYGVAGQIIAQSLWYAAVSSFFNASRGLAISIMMCGSAIASIIGPVMANTLIESYGFRTAFVAMGLSWGGATALASLFGIPSRIRSSAEATTAPLTGLTVREGFRSGAFYKLGFIILSSYVAIIAVVVHTIALFTGGGLSRHGAVAAASSFGGAFLLAKLSSGFAMDQVPAKFVAAFSNLVLMLSLAMLAAPMPSLPWALASAMMAGLAFGGFAPTYPYLATRYLGMRSFGRLFGALACAYAIGSGAGPLIAGYIHDVTHSYAPFLFGCMPALALAIALCLSLGRYPDFAVSNLVKIEIEGDCDA